MVKLVTLTEDQLSEIVQSEVKKALAQYKNPSLPSFIYSSSKSREEREEKRMEDERRQRQKEFDILALNVQNKKDESLIRAAEFEGNTDEISRLSKRIATRNSVFNDFYSNKFY
jgi:hypothetical protein